MAKATFNGEVLAESETFRIVEENVYFPPEDVNKKFFKDSHHHTTCPFKGEASYYHVEVDGETLENAAWYYPEPKEDYERIKNHVAFYTDNIEVER